MNYYGVLFSSFWDGDTGRAIAAAGGKDAQLVALYLTSCKAATMIGLFPLRIEDIALDIATLTPRQVEAALEVLGRPSIAFAQYDKRTMHIWVRQMAWYRLTLQKGQLSPDDNRAKGTKRLYDNLKPNPFLTPFYEHYRKLIGGLRRRDYDGEIDPPAPMTTISRALKGVPRGSEGASKPGNRSGSVQRSGSERTGDQDQGERAGAADAAIPPLSFNDFRSLFDEGHRSRTGVDAIFKRGDEDKIAPHLAIGRAKLERCIDAFFKTTDDFIIRAGFTVPVFVGQLGALVAQTSEADAERFRAEFPHGLGPGWQDECIALHGGACPSSFAHWQKTQAVSA